MVLLMRVLVLDTSAFIMGFNPMSVEAESYSVPSVVDELPKVGVAILRFNASIEGNRLKVRAPSESSFKTVSEVSAKLGEENVLSKTDLQVLALALDLKLSGVPPTIVSDDYAIQNVAEHLGLNYSSLATFGISYGFNWVSYCPACFKRYAPNYADNRCGVCGTKLKRKVLRRLKASKGRGRA